jgi:hypothetical protein
MSDPRVIAHVSSGGYPQRPSLEECRGFDLPDSLWLLLEQCWSYAPEQRPSMENIVIQLTQPNTQDWRSPLSNGELVCVQHTTSIEFKAKSLPIFYQEVA